MMVNKVAATLAPLVLSFGLSAGSASAEDTKLVNILGELDPKVSAALLSNLQNNIPGALSSALGDATILSSLGSLPSDRAISQLLGNQSVLPALLNAERPDAATSPPPSNGYKAPKL